MTEERSGPYLWVTWLSKLLVGDFSCEWAAWFKAHYKNYERMPSDFDVTVWQMNHTALLNDVRDMLEAEGRRVFMESQNYFNLRGSSGTVLGGKPDLVAVDDDGRAEIIDIKTGQPRASDNVQVMIYMYALPHIPQFRGNGVRRPPCLPRRPPRRNTRQRRRRCVQIQSVRPDPARLRLRSRAKSPQRT